MRKKILIYSILAFALLILGLLSACSPGDIADPVYFNQIEDNTTSGKVQKLFVHDLYTDNDTLYIGGQKLDIEGLQGIPGPPGESGEQGLTGPPGEQGMPGQQGQQGQQGIQGMQGIQGEIGTTGPQGIQGYSGGPGEQGVQGVQGVPGNAGSNGISISWNGTYSSAPDDPVLNEAYRNSTDNRSYIWDGAFWQIMTEDGQAGTQGSPGQTGSQGAKGDTGEQGLKGNTGDTGLQGSPGEAGEQGIQGIQGIQGVTGNTGATGPNSVNSTTTSTNINGIIAGDGSSIKIADNNSILIGTQESFTSALKTSYDWLVTNITSGWKTSVDWLVTNITATWKTSVDNLITAVANIGSSNVTTWLGYTPMQGPLVSGNITTALGFTPENPTNKDATGGYAGLTLFKINFKNVANTITSWFTNTNTVARTYTFQNRDGTIADDTDLSGKQATLVSGANIKTINGATVLGSGDLVVSGTATDPEIYKKLEMQIIKNQALTTVSVVGIIAPTLTVTLATADDADGRWLRHATTNVANNPSGVISALFTIFRRDWEPEYITTIKTDPSAITSVRYWVGMFSANPDLIARGTAATGFHCAAFSFDTGLSDTAFWRCTTSGGVANTFTTTITTQSIAVNTKYLMRIVCSTVDIKFYINDVLVATHNTNMPTSTQLLGYGNRVTTLTTAIRYILWGRIAIRTN